MKVTRAVAGAALATVLTTAAFVPVTANPAAAAAGSTTVRSDDSAGRRDGNEPSLRALARRADLRIGTAVDMAAFAADAVYREHVNREFSTVTTGTGSGCAGTRSSGTTRTPDG